MEICHQLGGNAGCWVLGGLGAAAGHRDDAPGSGAASRLQGPLRSRSWQRTPRVPGLPGNTPGQAGAGPGVGCQGRSPRGAQESGAGHPGDARSRSPHCSAGQPARPGARPEPVGSEPGEPSWGPERRPNRFRAPSARQWPCGVQARDYLRRPRCRRSGRGGSGHSVARSDAPAGDLARPAAALLALSRVDGSASVESVSSGVTVIAEAEQTLEARWLDSPHGPGADVASGRCQGLPRFTGRTWGTYVLPGGRWVRSAVGGMLQGPLRYWGRC